MRLFADPLRFGGRWSIAMRVDEVIKKHAKNWDLHRIAAVDRKIFSGFAIDEMLHREDIPPIVSINEAVDIAKKFSTQDSGKFVNGILDKVKGETDEVARRGLCNEFCGTYIYTRIFRTALTRRRSWCRRPRRTVWRRLR